MPISVRVSGIPAPEFRQVIAWAVQREGGGRGFAFTGGHYHKNMQIEGDRRMLLNAILWTAKVKRASPRRWPHSSLRKRADRGRPPGTYH